MDEMKKKVDAEHAALRQAAKIIMETLAKEKPSNTEESGSLNIMGFGTFKIRVRKACQRINPRTGETLKVPQKTVISFKASPTWVKSLNA